MKFSSIENNKIKYLLYIILKFFAFFIKFVVDSFIFTHFQAKICLYSIHHRYHRVTKVCSAFISSALAILQYLIAVKVYYISCCCHVAHDDHVDIRGVGHGRNMVCFCFANYSTTSLTWFVVAAKCVTCVIQHKSMNLYNFIKLLLLLTYILAAYTISNISCGRYCYCFSLRVFVNFFFFLSSCCCFQ